MVHQLSFQKMFCNTLENPYPNRTIGEADAKEAGFQLSELLFGRLRLLHLALQVLLSQQFAFFALKPVMFRLEILRTDIPSRVNIRLIVPCHK